MKVRDVMILMFTLKQALKLTVNDFVRSKTMDPETGRISLFWELVAGGAAGGSQVVSLDWCFRAG